MDRIYFDNAATTAIDPEVFDAMVPYMREHYGNPSAIHAFGRETRAALERSRRQVAALLNCAPGEIIFTSGGTEADNMVLNCAVRDLGVKHIITSPIEHHAIELTAHALCGENGPAKAHWLRLDAEGRPELAHLEELLQATKGEGVIVSIMHANNEIGTRSDLEAIGALCRKYNALFHSDTVQTMGHYAFDLATLPVDFITCAAHKFHGPKGVGFLFMRNSSVLKPMILGGSQERNMRAGTENLHGIVGLAKALEIAYRDLDEHQSHVQGLKDRMKERLKEEIPGVGFNGDASHNGLYTVLSVCFPENGRSEMLLYNLDIEGVACSGGSACSSGSNTGSHVLRTLYPERPGANIRFSFSRFSTVAEVEQVVAVLKRILVPVAEKV
ncbi:MAG TPA: cysteine desulfurase family protein [Flavobacteriales bacterium]|nr:cysteine desulfurase family protein [Flavobacteriales bacterium]HQW42299.1 cysteine desulfurase family protein [Flavobacteriales bacterium]